MCVLLASIYGWPKVCIAVCSRLLISASQRVQTNLTEEKQKTYINDPLGQQKALKTYAINILKQITLSIMEVTEFVVEIRSWIKRTFISGIVLFY